MRLPPVVLVDVYVLVMGCPLTIWAHVGHAARTSELDAHRSEGEHEPHVAHVRYVEEQPVRQQHRDRHRQRRSERRDITPFANKVLSELPAVNRPGATNNFESLPRRSDANDKVDAKVDYYAYSKWTMFGRYSHRLMTNFEPPAIPGPSGGNSNGNVRVLNFQIASGATWNMDPKSVMEFRVGIGKTEGGLGLDQLRAAIVDAVTADNAALGEAGAMLRAVDGIKSAVLKHLEPSLLPDFEPLTSILKPIAKIVEDVRATTAAVPAGAEAGAALDRMRSLGFDASRTLTSPVSVWRTPSAPRWYFTSPEPPSGSEPTASSCRSPSNSLRMTS